MNMQDISFQFKHYILAQGINIMSLLIVFKIEFFFIS